MWKLKNWIIELIIQMIVVLGVSVPLLNLFGVELIIVRWFIIMIGLFLYDLLFEKRLLAKLKPYLKNVYTYTDTEVEKKLAILHRAKYVLFLCKKLNKKRGLCQILHDSVVYTGLYRGFYDSISNIIEYCTFENAKIHANAQDNNIFWWYDIRKRSLHHEGRINVWEETFHFDYENRDKFLDWMIEQYKEDLKKEN